MRRRAIRAGVRRVLVGAAVFALVTAGWLVHAPRPAVAGYDCDPGMNCAKLTFVVPGNGVGTITANGVSCTVFGGIMTGDCTEIYNFATATLTVELTIMAGAGSVYITDLGGSAGPGVPVVAYVLLFPSGDGDTQSKEVRFNLGVQEILLVLEGPGSGIVRHTDEGIQCPTDCLLAFQYGEEIGISADPDPGSYLKSWSGICAGKGEVCVFNMPKSGVMTVTFGLTPTPTPTPTATPRRPTAAPTAVSSMAPTLEPSPSPLPATLEPSASVGASPTFGASATPGVSPVASDLPISGAGADGGFGSGLLIGVLIAAIVGVVGGLVLWRRRPSTA